MIKTFLCRKVIPFHSTGGDKCCNVSKYDGCRSAILKCMFGGRGGGDSGIGCFVMVMVIVMGFLKQTAKAKNILVFIWLV